MKVSVADFEIHLASFFKDVASAMPSSVHKFAIGAFATANAKRIENALVDVSDAEGMIDLDKAKALVDGGFSASGDVLALTIPGVPILGLPSVNFKLSKADADKFFAGFSPASHPATETKGK
jgi:hypothetical protein